MITIDEAMPGTVSGEILHFQHCGSQNLQRYLLEFDCRCTHRDGNGSEDDAGAEIALLSITGWRLTSADWSRRS